MKGEAEAFALEAKGRAEAEQMSKKAEAFKQYKDGAMVDMLLEKLPLVSLMILLIWPNVSKSNVPDFLQLSVSTCIFFSPTVSNADGRRNQQASVGCQ